MALGVHSLPKAVRQPEGKAGDLPAAYGHVCVTVGWHGAVRAGRGAARNSRVYTVGTPSP